MSDNKVQNQEGDRYFGISPRIARWKEPSEFENRLGLAAETDLRCRRLYSDYYCHLNPEYYNKGKEFASKLVDTHAAIFQGCDFETIYEDMVYCLHRYGLDFQDYCMFRLQDKSERKRNEFVSDKLRYHYCDLLNAPEVEELMTDKLKCYKEYSEFYKREVIGVRSEADKKSFMEFVSRHPKFIYKPLTSHSGNGILIVEVKSYDEALKWFNKTVPDNPGVAEELIVQGDAMSILHPSSINTCRLTTFTIGDEVVILGGGLRIGKGSAVVDNGGQGGMYANIDPVNGIITTWAHDYANQEFRFHPDTGVQIIGFKLPEWDRAIDLIRSMATHHKGATLVAWDIAYSKKGWVMVEGNDNGAWCIMQSNLQKGLKPELYALMDKYFAFKNIE